LKSFAVSDELDLPLLSAIRSQDSGPCAEIGTAATIEAMSERTALRDELTAAVEARKELGAEMEPAVIDAFLERIERRLADRAGESEQSLKAKREHQREMVLGAMGISVPLFIFAAIFAGLSGVLAVCGVLAVIAIASTR
jgi:hypothetical protein